jgi:hypothetical protein
MASSSSLPAPLTGMVPRRQSGFRVTSDERTAVAPSAIVLRSAGSVVEIRYVRRGATTSVMVTDVRTGDHVILDATELESLVRGRVRSYDGC